MPGSLGIGGHALGAQIELARPGYGLAELDILSNPQGIAEFAGNAVAD